MPGLIKLITELGPLLVFFASYIYGGMILATKAIMIFSCICLIIMYYYEKKIQTVHLCTTLFILVLGGATLMTGNTTFIKIKPTILYSVFSIVIFGGLSMNKPILKYILKNGISLTDHAWMIFSRRWGYLFIFLAIMNEVIWRNFSESTWVNFKVFGIIPIMLIFIMSQLPFLSKNKSTNKNT